MTLTRNTTSFGSKSKALHWLIHTTNGEPLFSILTTDIKAVEACICHGMLSVITAIPKTLNIETTEEFR